MIEGWNVLDTEGPAKYPALAAGRFECEFDIGRRLIDKLNFIMGKEADILKKTACRGIEAIARQERGGRLHELNPGDAGAAGGTPKRKGA